MERICFKDSVSETLLINLYMRYLDNKNEKSILKDEFSADIVKKIDYDFAKFNKSDLSKTGVVIRAKFFDDEIVEFSKQHNQIIVVQVGAGLDTRPLRLEKNIKNAIFYDLDLPDVIKLRDKLVPKAQKNTNIASSMLETSWMDKLMQKHPQENFIFVLEGVSMYFEENDLKDFFLNLAKRFNGIVELDFLSKWAAKNMNHKKHDTLKYMQNLSIKFGMDDPDEIQTWDKNAIKYIKTGVMMDMYKSNWSLKGRLMSLVPKFKNSCKMYVFSLNSKK